MQENVLKISEKGNRTIKKYFLEEDENKHAQINEFIKNIKLKHSYDFTIPKLK